MIIDEYLVLRYCFPFELVVFIQEGQPMCVYGKGALSAALQLRALRCDAAQAHFRSSRLVYPLLHRLAPRIRQTGLLLPPRVSDPGTGTATVCSQLGKIPYLSLSLSLCPSLFFFFVRLPFSFKFYVSLYEVCNCIFWCSTSVAYYFHTI
jgi:hypothetical protein